MSKGRKSSYPFRPERRGMFERVCHWCGYKWPTFVGNRCPRCGRV